MGVWEILLLLSTLALVAGWLWWEFWGYDLLWRSRRQRWPWRSVSRAEAWILFLCYISAAIITWLAVVAGGIIYFFMVVIGEISPITG